MGMLIKCASRLMVLNSENRATASYYGNVMFGCGKKAVLRMTPEMKKTICKSCQSPLIPGKTARVRLLSKPVKLIKWTCTVCNSAKKFPTKPGYKLWFEQPEALVETFHYTSKKKLSDSSENRTHDRSDATTKGSVVTVTKMVRDQEISLDANHSHSNDKEHAINTFSSTQL